MHVLINCLSDTYGVIFYSLLHSSLFLTLHYFIVSDYHRPLVLSIVLLAAQPVVTLCLLPAPPVVNSVLPSVTYGPVSPWYQPYQSFLYKL